MKASNLGLSGCREKWITAIRHPSGRGRRPRRPVSRSIIGHKPSVNGASRRRPLPEGFRMAVVPFLPTHRQTPIYTHPRPPARSPLSVTGFAPSAKECPESSPEGQPDLTNPPAFVRERPKAGGFRHISLGPRICASKAQMPHPLWEDT